MQKLLFSLLLVLTVISGNTQLNATAPVAPSSEIFTGCALPAPTWLNVTGATSSTISVAWNSVSGAALYRVRVTNITQGITYPEVFTTGTTYTKTGLQPLDVVQFEVSASSCATFNPDESYPSITEEGQTTRIIIEDIVQFNGNSVNQSGAVFNLSVGNTITLPIMPANSTTIQYRVVKITSPVGGKGGTVLYSATFAIWADCLRKVHLMTLEATNLTSFDLTELVPSTVQYRNGDAGDVRAVISNPAAAGMEMTVDISTVTNDYTKVMTGLRTGYLNSPCMTSGNGLVINDTQEWETSSESIDTDKGQTGSAGFATTSTPTDLQVVPNPFEDQIRLNFHLDAVGPVNVSLLDATGRTLRHLEVSEMDAGAQQLILQTENLPRGMYFIALQTEAGRETKTLIKQ